jgi:hypothetical protein
LEFSADTFMNPENLLRLEVQVLSWRNLS